MFPVKDIFLSPEVKDISRQLVQVRTQSITRDVLSEVLKYKPDLEVSEESVLQEAELYDFIQERIGAAYRLGTQDGSCTIAFLIAQ